MDMEKLFRLFNLHAAVSSYYERLRSGFRFTSYESDLAHNVEDARNALARDLGISPEKLKCYSCANFTEYEPKD